MANQKITDFSAVTTAASTDILPIVINPGSTPVNKKITLSNFQSTFSLPFTTVGFSKADYVCDGVADDVQIQAAIDAVSTAGGGIVYIKEGTYDITSNVNVLYTFYSNVSYYGIAIKNKVRLIGAGVGKTILNNAAFYPGASAGTGVYINGAAGDTDISVEDMTIQAPTYTAGTGGIWGGAGFMGAKRATLRNLRFVNAGWEFRAKTYSYNATTKELTTDVEDILVDNVIVDQFLGSCTLLVVKNFAVRNCKFYGAEDDALLIGSAAQHGNITDCIIDGQLKTTSLGASTAGIYLANDGAVHADLECLSDIKIEGCTIRRGQLKSGSTDSGIGIGRSKNIIIANNTIEQNHGHGIDDHGGSQIEEITITGNTIRANGNGGISFGQASNTLKNITISGNRCYNNSGDGYGIRIYNNAVTDGIIVTDNECFDNQTPKTQLYGIVVATTGAAGIGTNVLVENNNCHGNSTLDFGVSTASGSTLSAIVRNNNGVNEVLSKSISYALAMTDEEVLGTSGAGGITITLPTAVDCKGKIYTIKKVDGGAGALTVATTSAQTIDGATTAVINNQYESIDVVSDNANWNIT